MNVASLAGAVLVAMAIFSLFVLARGAAPLQVLADMATSALGSRRAIGEILVQATPFVLAALATALPSRAGLFNIGAEGQLVSGAIGAMAAANAIGGGLPTPVTLALMAAGGIVAGALWALGPTILRVAAGVSEVISTLLLNNVAFLVLAWLVHGRWKDAASLGLPQGRDLATTETLPVIFSQRVHLGVVLAVVAAVVVWALLRFTGWGFRLRAVGGNPEAARRAGLPVGWLIASAMLTGGAIAGLGGMIELAGIEGRVRPDMLVGFGYIGFLASWLVRHHPGRVVAGALLLATIAVGGNSLQLDAGLPAASVNILMALVLLAVLGRRGRAMPGVA